MLELVIAVGTLVTESLRTALTGNVENLPNTRDDAGCTVPSKCGCRHAVTIIVTEALEAQQMTRARNS